MSERSPQNTADQAATREAQTTKADDGIVISSPSFTGGEEHKHLVMVRPAPNRSPIPCTVPVNAHGDAHIPPKGSEVEYVPSSGGSGTIIGIKYARESPPDYEAGERTIGHAPTDSQIHFERDGSLVVKQAEGAQIRLDSDGSVYVGNQSGDVHIGNTERTRGAITDITQDSDGNLTIERSETVYIE